MYFGFTGKRTGLTNVITSYLKNLSKGFYLGLDVIGTAILGIASAWTTSKGLEQYEIYFEWSWKSFFELLTTPIFYVFIGLILYLISKVFQWHDSNDLFIENKNLKVNCDNLDKKLRTISEDNGDLKFKISILYKELVRTWLKSSMQKLSIYDPDTRVTIYYFKKNYFYYVGRYSVNPLNSIENTSKFELNGGVISQAWKKQTHKDLVNCPVFEGNEDAYYAYVGETYNFDKSKMLSLGMKSCQYYARRIDDTSEPIGMIVFESSKKFFTDRSVKKIESHCAEHESNLISYIRYIRDNDQQSIDNNNDIESEFFKGMEGIENAEY